MECEVYVDGIRLEIVSELSIWDVFWTNQIQTRQCTRKVASGRSGAGAIRSLANASLSVLVLHERRRRSRITAVKMDNLRGLLGIRRMDRISNSRRREWCGVKKGLDERNDEGLLSWLGHVEKMKSDRIAKSVM